MGRMKWYVVHTYSGHERRAKQLLLERIRAHKMQDRFGEIIVPAESAGTGPEGKSRRRYLPGYMLVQMDLDDDVYHLVKGTDKITGFVGPGNRPTPITEEEVRRMTQQTEEAVERTVQEEHFEEGMQVRVKAGAFENFTGVIEEVRPDKQRVRVLVSIFGRPTPVDLHFSEIERV